MMSLLVGLFLLATGTAEAQPKVLSISLTATYQASNVTSGANQDLTTSATKPFKLNSDTLITLIASNLGLSSAAGYKLIYDPIVGTIGLTNSATQNFQDASSLLSIETNGVSVQSGKSNSDTGAESETITAYTVITFNDGNGNAFTISGLVKEIVSQPAPTAAQTTNGITPNQTASLSGTVTGYGTVVVGGNSNAAVFSGTIAGGATDPGN